MVQARWAKSCVAVLVLVGSAWGQQSTGIPSTYTKGDTITLQEPGKAEQKVKVIKTSKSADGKVVYEVQDLQTGDTAIISDSPMAMPTMDATAPAPKKKLLGLFSRPSRTAKKNDTMAPAKHHDAAKKSIETELITPATSVQPASGTMFKRKELPKNGPAAKVDSSDWQKSWGKANDHKSPLMAIDMDECDDQLELASYQQAPMPTANDGALTIQNYPVTGSPYWHVPRMPSRQAGVARVAR